MYQLGRNFKRCQVRAKEFQSVSKRITKENNRSASKCLKELEKMRVIMTSPTFDSSKADPVCLIHLQQMLLVAAYNMLVGKIELVAEPHLVTKDGAFEMGTDVHILEHVIDHLKLDQLLEKLNSVVNRCYMGAGDKEKLFDVQCEVIDQVLKSIDLKYK